MQRTIQVAIDDPKISQIEHLLQTLCDARVDLIEMGTPYLTIHGLTAVDRFSKIVPVGKIYADIKSTDLAVQQTQPFLDAGILHFSAHISLEYAQAEQLSSLCSKYGAECFLSTLGFPADKLPERVSSFQAMGFSNFVAHGEGLSPDDALDRALLRLEKIKTIARTSRLILAGGIARVRLSRIPFDDIHGVIVGRGILQSHDIASEVAYLREFRNHG